MSVYDRPATAHQLERLEALAGRQGMPAVWVQQCLQAKGGTVAEAGAVIIEATLRWANVEKEHHGFWQEDDWVGAALWRGTLSPPEQAGVTEPTPVQGLLW